MCGTARDSAAVYGIGFNDSSPSHELLDVGISQRCSMVAAAIGVPKDAVHAEEMQSMYLCRARRDTVSLEARFKHRELKPDKPSTTRTSKTALSCPPFADAPRPRCHTQKWADSGR